MNKHSIILLDVMVENLQDGLLDKGWNVKTVTTTFGATKDDRADTKILEYTKDNNCTVITGDKKLIRRLREEGLKVLTVTDAEMTNTIHQKLSSEYD